MNTIMEYLQAQKATTSTSYVNPTTIVVTDAIIIVTTTIDTTANTMIQPVISQPICQPGPSKHVVSYPWGIPPIFTPQVANGNAFVPYQPFVVHPANGNTVDHPWGMTTHYPQMVGDDNHEINP